MRFFHKHVTCRVKGHFSMGTFLSWMCDRCHEPFTPEISYWAYGVKISKGR